MSRPVPPSSPDTWPFSCQVTGGGRGLAVRHGRQRVAELAFGLPGEPVPGFTPDEDEVRLTRAEAFTARLRHTPDATGWVSTVSLDNHTDAERALPPLGVAVTLAPAWVGWSWSSDTEGFIVCAPAAGTGPCLLVGVRRGFFRAAQSAPVFLAADRRGEGLGAGVAAFHLAHPTGSLRPLGRHVTTLEFSSIATVDAAASQLPAWLPDLLVAPRDEMVLRTPDLGVTPGAGVDLTTVGTDALVTGEPGHRELAVHGVRGVQRLRVSFTPEAGSLVMDLAAERLESRPGGSASSAAAVVAGALAHGLTPEPERALDWLEREDWLGRGDVWGPAISGVIAQETRDPDLLRAACDAVAAADYVPGLAVIGTRLWWGTLRAGLPPFALTDVFDRATDDPLAQLENAVLRNLPEERWGAVASGFVNRLGGGLPGQPVGLSEADAGLAIALLRMVPEHWAVRRAATQASEKAEALLLCDHADRLHPALDGLAWLLMGEIGS